MVDRPRIGFLERFVLEIVELVGLEDSQDRPLDQFLVLFRASFALPQNSPILISLVRLVLELWEDGISPGSNTPRCAKAAVISLDAVDIGDEVLGRVQVECGREEVNYGEKQEKDKHEETDNERSNPHHGWHEDGMTRTYIHLSHAV